MHTFKGIQYAIKKAHNGLLLTIPKFDIEINVDETFKESELLNYI